MTKLTDEAKNQNEESKRKQRIEDKEASWESPEQLRKDGGDVHPPTTVVPNTQDPSDDPATKGTRYDPTSNGAKPE